MAAIRIAIADYGAGNMVSIARALETIGASVTVATDPDGLAGADALVVPGVGAAAPAMARLERHGLVEPIREWIATDRPFLGICLGLQLLFEGSDEDGAATLGVLAGRTVRLRDAPTLPHIGWNQVERRREHPILDGVPDGADLYFVHSFVAAPADPIDDRRRDDPWVDLPERRRGRERHRRPVPPRAERNRWPARPGQLRGDRLRGRAAAHWREPAGRRRADPRRSRTLMLRRRVIPCLDVADGRVVKGTRFVDLVDEGDPAELAARYAAEGADEIVFLDISAAPERRGTLLEVVERTARNVFIPLTVGGGVRSVDDMRSVLRAGADKVGLNTAAVADPDLIARCAERFGRQAVVVAIDARTRTGAAGWEVVVRGGREATGRDAIAWAVGPSRLARVNCS